MAELSNGKLASLITEKEAEKCTMSICISTDGLAFFISSSETSSLLHSDKILFAKKDKLSLEGELSELIYNHPFLTYPYQDVTISFPEENFILIPPGIAIEGKENLWISSSLILQDDSVGYVATYPINEYGIQLLACWSSKAYSFLRRTYPYRTIEASIVKQLKEAINSSHKESPLQLFVFIANRHINLIACHKGAILLANKFELAPTLSPQGIADQILFYIGSSLNALNHTASTIEEKLIVLNYTEPLPKEETQKVALVLQENIPSLGITYKWSSQQ